MKNQVKTVNVFIKNLLLLMVLSGLSLTQTVAQPVIELSQKHIDAVNRHRGLVLQYDAYGNYKNMGVDFKKWITGVFKSVDQPGNQVDAIWWDIGGYSDMSDWPNSLYQNYVGGLPYVQPKLKNWWDQGIDWISELVGETRKRKLEVFWNHRISEVFSTIGWKGPIGPVNPLMKAHPDWFIRSWYDQGLWNLASPEVRQYKLAYLTELIQRYELDGIQLDFARHVPCLPVGRQWELRDNVTEFVQMVRLMMLEMEKKLGRPLLLAVKVPQNLEGCHVDGFDVETWAKQNLVDIFTLGTRSIDVDLAFYRRITAGLNIKLQPCWDDHHSTDAYRSPPLETYRGIFGNWWQQGADGVVIFNWVVDGDVEYNRVKPLTVASEVGSLETLYLKDKIFIVERKGGYPWSEGFFGRNDTSPLPSILANDGRPSILIIKVCDNLRAYYDKINHVILRAVIFNAKEGDEIGVRFNGVAMLPLLQDHAWKDNQILSPNPQQPSGGGMEPDRPVDPNQKLLRLDFNIQPGLCRLGENRVEVYIINRVPYGHMTDISNIILEKLELHVDYK
jgi:hypothetical protein